MTSLAHSAVDLLWDGILATVMVSAVFAETSLMPMWTLLGVVPLLACRVNIIALERQLA